MKPELLRACCGSEVWVDAVLRSSSADGATLMQAGAAAFDALEDAEVLRVARAHPALGERPTGESTEDRWARSEQADMRPSEQLAAANRRYRRRFGYVFLLCAAGRTDAEALAEIRRRLENTDDDELVEVRRELRAITLRRLEHAMKAEVS